MVKNKVSVSMIMTVAITLATVFFQNCASDHDSGSDAFATKILSAGACTQILKDGFVTTGYYDFVKTYCTNCHTTNGAGTGKFADNDVAIASEQFLVRTEDKVAEFSLSSHQASTGEQHADAIANLSAAWDEVEVAYSSCVAAAGNNGNGQGGGVGGGEVVTPTLFTADKPYNANAGQEVVMSWTGAELAQAIGPGVTGTLEMTMEAFDLGGNVTGYYFSAPRLVNDGGQAIYLYGVGVRVNGTLVANGTTWYGLQRYVPANDSRQLSPNGGSIVLISPINQDLNVALGVTELVVSPINFQPVTYTDLQAAGGIFTTSCGPCHQGNGSGGFDISYQGLIGGYGASGKALIQKFYPSGSEFYVRMEDAGAPMPTAGLLPPAQRAQVRDWILDGAPEDNNDIAR